MSTAIRCYGSWRPGSRRRGQRLLLVFSEWAEDRVVSPRALIVRAANGRRLPPEETEAFVAAESDRLLNRPGLKTVSR